MAKRLFIHALLLTAFSAIVQVSFEITGGAQAPAQPREAAQPVNQSDDPLLRAFRWRSIGPASMMGRVDDIAVVESNTSIWYVGYATGGLWKTVNNGTTFTAIFDNQPVSSIGDIAIAPSNPDIIYVGTGEPNNRQSSSFGGGVYKSTDAGKTFTLVGLTDTQSIGRIVVHPKDPNTAYVAAVGHLFGPNEERGLFKTTDGGKTWTNVKKIDADTGFTDVAMDLTDPNTLYAASYQRRRVPWGFNGGGPGSGLWKTSDAGKTWTRLTGSGLPDNPILGRIGVDVCRSNPNVVYAQFEVGPSGQGGGGGGGGGGGQAVPAKPLPPDPKRSGIWRSDDRGKTWRIASNNNNRPMYYSQVRCDPKNPDTVYTLGLPLHKSTDGGKTFREMPNIAHVDHHALWVDPTNPNHLIIGNDGGIDISWDQGETWEYVPTMAAGQFYHVGVDMRDPYYVCGGLQDNGSWCGPSRTRSQNGIINADWYRIGGGDGFYAQIDPTDWATVYTESQQGNMSRLDLRTGERVAIQPRAPQAPGRGGRGVGGGEAGRGGAPPAAGGTPPGRGTPPTPGQPTPAVPQPESEEQPPPQGRGGGLPPNVVPTPPAGTQFRFYWNTPIVLSPHNPRTVYVGGDRFFKSMDRGNTWTMSADLTRNIGRNDRPIMGVPGDQPMASKHDGMSVYSTVTTIAESPVLPGVIWAGTTDGNVQLSRDAGTTFKNVVDNIKGVPAETHVSRVEASHHDAGTAYVSFDGHRTDDHKPYVFVTRDFGATWTSIAANLPTGNVNTIREDPRSRNLLYVGTEYAFFVSLDGGKEWKRFMNGLPTVRIDDVVVHPRENDLVLATHGRSVWIMDDITALQQLSERVSSSDVHLFQPRAGTLWAQDIQLTRYMGGSQHFVGENPPFGTAISYHLRAPVSGEVRIAVTDVSGTTVRDLTGSNLAGINRINWDFRANPRPGQGGGRGGGGGGGQNQGPLVAPGQYLVKLTAGGKTLNATVTVKPDRIER